MVDEVIKKVIPIPIHLAILIWNNIYNSNICSRYTWIESNEEVIEVTTDNYVNPVVNSVTATNVENDSITVSVSASAGTNAIQTYHYSINNGAYTSSSANTYTFSGLNSGTNYSIRVYVTDTTGVESNVYTINAETISCTKYLAVGTKLLSALVTNYPLLDLYILLMNLQHLKEKGLIR